MPLESTEQIQAGILDLCSEDAYGSWELWWNISADIPTDEIPELKNRFLDVVNELVSVAKLMAKSHSADGNIAATQFGAEKLAREIDSADDPNPNSFFWFGTE